MNRYFLLLISLLSFFSCRKATIEQPPPPLDRDFRISLAQLPGNFGPQQNLKARLIISHINGNIALDREIDLTYNGIYRTETLNLPAGKYKISGFWILKDQRVLFVSPKTGSVRAYAVQRPLDMEISLAETIVKNIDLEVAVVENGDKAPDFGYSANAFDLPEPDSELMKIRVQAKIKVGTVLYDYIPGRLIVRNEFADGSELRSVREIMAGDNELVLDRRAVSYELIFSKWGKDYRRSFRQNEVNDNILVIIGGEIQALQLKEEIVAFSTNGVFKAFSKKEYIYDLNDRVEYSKEQRKREDGTVYLYEQTTYSYANGRVQALKRTNEQGQQTGQAGFNYDGRGKLLRAVDQSGDERSEISLSYLPVGQGEDNFELAANFRFDRLSQTLTRTLDIVGGNTTRSVSTSSSGDMETILNEYDFNLNPYIHLGLPDLTLLNHSKHNCKMQYYSFEGKRTEFIPVAYHYVYNTDGYPTEQTIDFNSTITNRFAYSKKTTYRYR